MVTLVILSAGIVLIFKTFFLCVDYLNRLSIRLYASELVDEKIADLSRAFRLDGNPSVIQGPSSVEQNINHKPIDFLYQVQFDPVQGYEGLYRLEVGVSWVDAGRPARFARSTLVAL